MRSNEWLTECIRCSSLEEEVYYFVVKKKKVVQPLMFDCPWTQFLMALSPLDSLTPSVSDLLGSQTRVRVTLGALELQL